MTESGTTTAGMIDRRLIIPIYAVWIAIFGLTTAFVAVGLHARYQQLSVACSEPTAERGEPCGQYQLSPAAEKVLADWGLSLSDYASYMTALVIVSAPLYLITSLVIFLSRRRQLNAFYPSLGLILFLPAYYLSIADALTQRHPDWTAAIGWLQTLSFWFVPLFSFTFPSGRLSPSWTRPLMILSTPAMLALALNPPVRLFATSGPALAYWLSFVVVGMLLASVLAQISRYRNLSNASERQQIKWIVFGFAVAVVEIVIYVLAPILYPGLSAPGRAELLYTALGAAVNTLTFLLVAASFALAILRYRLFDIDVIINRTLVYAVLTFTLGGIYVGSILLAEFLLRPLTRESDLAVALSTLAVAALFHPVRQRIQAYVDRRFFRRKYDAQRIIDSFRSIARDEVDLEQVRQALIQVAAESMQPSYVSVWLRNR